MRWWQKALIGSALLLAFDGLFAYVMFQRISQRSSTVQIESLQHEQLGNTCGQILGLGLVLIWGITYFFGMKMKQRAI